MLKFQPVYYSRFKIISRIALQSNFDKRISGIRTVVDMLDFNLSNKGRYITRNAMLQYSSESITVK